MNETIIFDYFEEQLRHRNKGVISYKRDKFDKQKFYVGVGDAPFLYIHISSNIVDLYQCLLFDDTFNHKRIKTFPDKLSKRSKCKYQRGLLLTTLPINDYKLTIDLTNPYSIQKIEYIINRIITAVKKAVYTRPNHKSHFIGVGLVNPPPHDRDSKNVYLKSNLKQGGIDLSKNILKQANKQYDLYVSTLTKKEKKNG